MKSPGKRKTSEVLRLHIAKQVKIKREQANLTQIELARLMGFKTKQVIDNWEKQTSLPSLGTLYLLSMAFNSPIEDFLLSVEEFAQLGGIALKEVTVRRIIMAGETSEAPQ